MLYLKNIFGLIVLMLVLNTISAQNENKYIRRGNGDFEEQKYFEAERNYMKSLEKGGDAYKGLFNLGDVYYAQDDYGKAGTLFDSVARLNVDQDISSQAFYNLGNTLLSASLISDTIAAEALPLSIESYKNALRLNPADTAAKYNLAYAQQMMKNQEQNQDQQQDQQQNQDQNQDKEQNQDQENQDQENQDQENQDQEQDQEEQNQDQKQDQQNKDQQQQDGESQQSQGQQPKQISKEDAERMLEAMKNDEKKTLEKVKLGQAKGKTSKSEKDW